MLFGSGLSYAAGEYSAAEADSFYHAQDWDNAVKAYRFLTGVDISDTQAWFRLGLALHNLKKYEDAIEAYRHADRPGSGQQFTRYNIACSYSLLGDRENAFNWLDKSIEAGISDVNMLNNDPDLETLRGDPRFPDILLRADRNARPCQYDEEYSQLDFWVGEWNVYNLQDRKIGLNIIEKVLGGCLIRENWTSRNGFQGSSINYYDPSSGKWRQQWVDETGSIIRYSGEFRDSLMYFEGESISPNNKITLSRMSLIPHSEEKVEQIIEQSSDNGQTWNVWFHGIYLRKN
jgi:tetratricopeptide (TPR) repeat protein